MDKNIKHTEEFYEVANREPESYTSSIVYGLFSFVLLIILLSFIIKVPNIVQAEVRVTSTRPPTVLKAQVDGKIVMLAKGLPKRCHKGEYVALVENPANYKHVQKIKDWLQHVNIWNTDLEIDTLVESSFHLGTMENSFYALLKAYVQYKIIMGNTNNFHHEKALIEHNITHGRMVINNNLELLGIYKEEQSIRKAVFTTDSALFQREAVLKDDLDKAYLDFLNIKGKVISSYHNINEAKLSIQENEIKKLKLKDEKEFAVTEIRLALGEAYHKLIAEIENWENLYVFKAPHDGILEYANIISDGMYISTGEMAFNFIYEKNTYYGIAMLPANGAGDVRVGEKVNIKVDLYPYQEYGVLNGVVSDISLNSVEKNYLVYIKLPNGIVSEQEKELSFAETMYGTAEIVTEEKRLITSLFYKISTLLTDNGPDTTIPSTDKTQNPSEKINPEYPLHF